MSRNVPRLQRCMVLFYSQQALLYSVLVNCTIATCPNSLHMRTILIHTCTYKYIHICTECNVHMYEFTYIRSYDMNTNIPYE